jgi:uncharacterized protein YqeY
MRTAFDRDKKSLLEMLTPNLPSLQKIITQAGATSVADLGKVMGMASKHFAGKADNKMVSQLVKQLLGGS